MATDSQCAASGGSAVSALSIFLMNLWAYPSLVLWTFFGILVFPFLFSVLWLFLRWPTGRLTRWFIWMYGRGWLLLMSPFVQFRRENMGVIGQGKPYLFTVNHLSFFDTYCMGLLPVYDVVFAVRSWPFRMLWYGSFMRLAEYLDVENGSLEETISRSKAVFSGKGTVLFFPEGHRSRDGQLQRFYSGGFNVAIAGGVPIIPLCITGTDRFLPPGRKLFHPCRVRLKALEPIDTRDFREENGHVRLRKLVKEQMSDALEKMRAEED
ncbi:MAG: 1-acyl-sn-glycerol-3-phosphate acyltransferase [Deltaproteobacteria bacterium]|nr:1-acyl-sn-glycerol-3-phosphate acyltransferase [Deltaproteobacteria bacterium]